MASKSALAVIVSVTFAIVLTVAPIPTAWRVPVVAAAWALFAASLLGWFLSVKRSLSPIEKREHLDALAKTGNALRDKCLSDKNITFITKLGTKYWLSSVKRFAKHNFNMAQYDRFTGNQPRPTTIFRIEYAKTKAQFPAENLETAYEIIGCLEGLEHLRDTIRG
jgi:hypothetical protein